MHRAALICLGLFAASVAAPDSNAPILIAAGRWNQARAMIEPRVKANPADAEAAAMLSQVRLAFGDLDGAIAMAETAIRLNGKVAEYHWLLARACGEKARVSGILKALGLAKRFRQEAEEAIALDPGHIPSRLYLISYYAGAPGIAGGDRKKAEQLVDEVAGLDPSWGFVARARLLEETAAASDGQAAVERAGLYRKALDAVTTAEARCGASIALLNLSLAPSAENFDRAIQYGREATRCDPPRVDPYIGLAIAYASRGLWKDLDATLAEAEKVIPENLAPWYQAGRVTFLQGKDYARAERYFRKFLTAEPEPGPLTLAHGHWRLGLTLEKLGQRTEAIAELELAARLKPDFESASVDLRRVRGG